MSAENPNITIIPVSEFIQGVTELVRAEEGADQALIDVLEKHVLTVAPAQDAAKKAVKAIQELAEQRAKNTQKKDEGQTNAGADNG